MPLDPKHIQAIEALLDEPTIRQAAKRAKVSEQTLHRWLALDEFAAELDRRQIGTLRRTASVLKQRALAAVEKLSRQIENPKAKANNVISAADKLLTQNLRYQEQVCTMERLDELQAQIDALKNPQPVETPKHA